MCDYLFRIEVFCERVATLFETHDLSRFVSLLLDYFASKIDSSTTELLLMIKFFPLTDALATLVFDKVLAVCASKAGKDQTIPSSFSKIIGT